MLPKAKCFLLFRIAYVSWLLSLPSKMQDTENLACGPKNGVKVTALKAMYELHAQVTCRSIDGKGLNDTPKPPATDPLFARKSALRKDDKIRLGRIQKGHALRMIHSHRVHQSSFMHEAKSKPRQEKCSPTGARM
jgi:hypothetical protein